MDAITSTCSVQRRSCHIITPALIDEIESNRYIESVVPDAFNRLGYKEIYLERELRSRMDCDEINFCTYIDSLKDCGDVLVYVDHPLDTATKIIMHAIVSQGVEIEIVRKESGVSHVN